MSLTAIALPFVAFSFYLNEQMAQRLTRNVVQQALLGLAKDLATQIDSFILERRRDVALLAGMPVVEKPGTPTAMLAWRLAEIIVESKVLPEGAFEMGRADPGIAIAAGAEAIAVLRPAEHLQALGVANEVVVELGCDTMAGAGLAAQPEGVRAGAPGTVLIADGPPVGHPAFRLVHARARASAEHEQNRRRQDPTHVCPSVRPDL